MESVLYVFVAAWFATLTGVVGAILGRRYEAVRDTRQRFRDLAEARDLSAQRLARVETIVDAMSVEVERVAEGQRFVTKLLIEAPLVRDDRGRSPRTPVPAIPPSPPVS
jgi:hypothetical protein